MRYVLSPLLVLAVLIPCPAPACSLCGMLSKRESLVAEYERATAAAYGRLANPMLNTQGGAGTTEFHVEKVLKPAPELKVGGMILLSSYLPVLNPKDPPRYVMLFGPVANKLQATGGRQVHSPALLDLLTASQKVQGRPRPEALEFFARYLDHNDAAVAEEAFLQFARSTDEEVAAAARRLKPDVFRKLVKDPAVEAEQLSLYAYLLGATGGPTDADLLAGLLKQTDDRTTKALEGILAGYIRLRPKEGWAWAFETLQDPKRSYLVRHGIVRTMRFFHASQPEAYAKQISEAARLMVLDGELADSAVSDLQKWKAWDHSRLIFEQYGKPTHAAPITRNAILRYALACPLPEAKAFIERVRTMDGQLVRELEEDLAFERGN